MFFAEKQSLKWEYVENIFVKLRVRVRVKFKVKVKVKSKKSKLDPEVGVVMG